MTLGHQLYQSQPLRLFKSGLKNFSDIRGAKFPFHFLDLTIIGIWGLDFGPGLGLSLSLGFLVKRPPSCLKVGGSP